MTAPAVRVCRWCQEPMDAKTAHCKTAACSWCAACYRKRGGR